MGIKRIYWQFPRSVDEELVVISNMISMVEVWRH